jgi:hypothetical protein
MVISYSTMIPTPATPILVLGKAGGPRTFHLLPAYPKL